MAIAGEGGVASSKPVATAVVGPGGLAVARPIATALAGISPSEVSALGIPIHHKYKAYFRAGTAPQQMYIPSSKKYGLATGNSPDRLALLVGPDYAHESRINEKNISALDDQSTVTIVAPAAEEVDSKMPLDEKKEDSTGENELLPPLKPRGPRPQPTTAEPIHPVPYPFIPPVSPFRFNWDTEPLEPAPGYEPIPFFDQRAYNFPQFYPFPNVLPIHPFQFQNRF